MERIRAAVIGTGFIGKQHMEAISRVPGAELVAIADKSEAIVSRLAEEWGVAGYTDYEELLLREKIDVVHICTINSLHYPVCKKALQLGKHIYCEKPLTVNLWEAKELAELAVRQGAAAAADFNYRNNAMVREMRERIRADDIGIPLLIHCSYLQDWMLYDTDYDWRLEPENAGLSRAVADIGSHCFDTVQFLLGRKITSVYAKLITVYEERKKVEKAAGTFSGTIGEVLEIVPVANEDAAYILFQLEGGLMGSIEISQVSAGSKNELQIKVDGSRMALKWNQERPDKLWIGKRDGGNEELCCAEPYLTGGAKAFATLPAGHCAGWADAFTGGIRCFYSSIMKETYRETIQEYATFPEAVRIMRLVEACMESSRKNRWVEIEDEIWPEG